MINRASIDAIRNFEIGKQVLGTDGVNFYIVGKGELFLRKCKSLFIGHDQAFKDCKSIYVAEQMKNVLLNSPVHNANYSLIRQKLVKLRNWKNLNKDHQSIIDAKIKNIEERESKIEEKRQGKLKISASIIQRYFRGWRVRKRIQFKYLAPGLSNITCTKLKGLIGCEDFDSHPQKISITSIDLTKFKLSVVGGKKDESYLFDPEFNKQYFGDKPAAFINGGFHSIANGEGRWFYSVLYNKQPIGLQTTTNFNNVKEINLKYKTFSIPNYLLLKNQSSLKVKLSNGDHIPSDYRDHYGVLTISKNQKMEILSYPTSLNDRSHKIIKSEDTQFNMSAGPILVKSKRIIFTEKNLEEPRFQWKVISDKYGNKRGACPPGCLYHADQPNPRSAIGIKQEQIDRENSITRILMVTVLGREEDAQGLNLAQMANLMSKIGSENALNLDGGTPSVMGFKAGKEEKMQLSNPDFVDVGYRIPIFIAAEPR